MNWVNKPIKMFSSNILHRHVEGDRITTRLSSASSYTGCGKLCCFKMAIEEYKSNNTKPSYKHAIYENVTRSKHKRCKLFQYVEEPYTAMSNLNYEMTVTTDIST